MSLQQAKQSLLEEPEPVRPLPLHDWIVRHPGSALAIAAGAGAAFAMFPRLRKIALPLATVILKRAAL